MSQGHNLNNGDSGWTPYNDGSGAKFRRGGLPRNVIEACQKVTLNKTKHVICTASQSSVNARDISQEVKR